MSFYTGKDNSNNAILHITNGVTPQSSMKSGVLANKKTIRRLFIEAN